MVLQIIINGLRLGGMYAAVGVGFSLVWGVMHVINIAHGAMIMMGAYITYVVSNALGMNPFLTVPISMVLLFITGYLLQKFIINRVMKTGVFMTLIMAYGLNILIINIAYIIFKADYRSIPTMFGGAGLEFGGVVVPYGRLIMVLIALVMTLLLQ